VSDHTLPKTAPVNHPVQQKCKKFDMPRHEHTPRRNWSWAKSLSTWANDVTLVFGGVKVIPRNCSGTTFLGQLTSAHFGPKQIVFIPTTDRGTPMWPFLSFCCQLCRAAISACYATFKACQLSCILTVQSGSQGLFGMKYAPLVVLREKITFDVHHTGNCMP